MGIVKKVIVSKKTLQVLFIMLSAAVMIVYAACYKVSAFEIKTGNEDISLRWDNTFKYNYAARLKSPDNKYILNANMDDGDRNFNKGTVTNRLDILSELDFRYKENHGIRLSGAFWYDQRYNDTLGNDSSTTSNHIENGRQALGLSDFTKRQDMGPGGELLDAFIFSKVDLGPVPVNIKIGRHTVYWGESLFSYSNGISYAQFPVDLAKGVAVPGTEAKELYRPLFNISGQAQLTNNLSFAGQYFLEWQSNKYPESGSYWSSWDYLLKGADSMVLAPGVVAMHGDDFKPNGRRDWGVALKYNPEFLGANIGLYYRRTTDKNPQLNYDYVHNKYFLTYGDGIDIYGVSISKVILGQSVGFEYSYRNNMPLKTGVVIVSPLQKIEDGDLLGARGNTHHALINVVGTMGQTPLYDNLSYVVEFTYNRLDRLNQGEKYYLGSDSYTGFDRADREALAVQVSVTPMWLNVFPNMDLSMPMTFGTGLGGVSPVTGDAEGCWNLGAALELNIYAKYTVRLSYVSYYGRTVEDSKTGALSYYRGSAYNDRDTIGLTLKASF